MEGLNVLVDRDLVGGNIKGVKLPKKGPLITHLMFADDVVFIGEHDNIHLTNLNRIFRCFFLISGLKINYSKSCLYGTEIEDGELKELADLLNCKKGSFPFPYLGLWVGARSNAIATWKPVIERFNKRLSSWKARCLSLAGRIQLAKSVLGSLPTYYLSLYKFPKEIIKSLESIRNRFIWKATSSTRKIRWIAWDRIIREKKLGGLGLGGLREMNLSLLAKWWWRFRLEKDSLWGQVIKAIHGNLGPYKIIPTLKSSHGIWKNIGGIHKDIEKYNINLSEKLRFEMGRGNTVLFWHDKWTGDLSLKEKFPSAYNITKDKWSTVYDTIDPNGGWRCLWAKSRRSSEESNDIQNLFRFLEGVSTPEVTKGDKWGWGSDTGLVYTVNEVRRDLDKAKWSTYDTNYRRTVWCSWVPPKVNIMVWRAELDRLPTADQLSKRGVQVGDGICARCGNSQENVQHCFFACSHSSSIWAGIGRWLNSLNLSLAVSMEDVLREDGGSCSAAKNKANLMIKMATIWKI